MKYQIIAMLAAALRGAPQHVAKVQQPTSNQIAQAVRGGSLEFATYCRNTYVGDQLRRPYECGRNDVCPCGSGKKFKKCCKPA